MPLKGQKKGPGRVKLRRNQACLWCKLSPVFGFELRSFRVSLNLDSHQMACGKLNQGRQRQNKSIYPWLHQSRILGWLQSCQNAVEGSQKTTWKGQIAKKPGLEGSKFNGHVSKIERGKQQNPGKPTLSPKGQASN